MSLQHQSACNLAAVHAARCAGVHSLAMCHLAQSSLVKHRWLCSLHWWPQCRPGTKHAPAHVVSAEQATIQCLIFRLTPSRPCAGALRARRISGVGRATGATCQDIGQRLQVSVRCNTACHPKYTEDLTAFRSCRRSKMENRAARVLAH